MFRNLTLTCLLVLCSLSGSLAFTQEVIFEDRFEGALKPGWVWLRENSGCRRFGANALEILTEPFGNGDARNVLARPLNFFRWQNGNTDCAYRIETECSFLGKPQAKYQQCGVYWLQNEKVLFKLVFEHVDGKIYVYPGKVPVNSQGGRLRITVVGQNIVAEFCGLNETTFRRVYEGKINSSPNDRISLQCWNGPQQCKELEQWTSFRYFRVEKLSE